MAGQKHAPPRQAETQQAHQADIHNLAKKSHNKLANKHNLTKQTHLPRQTDTPTPPNRCPPLGKQTHFFAKKIHTASR